MAASVQKRGRFGCHGDDTLDEFLLNQVAKFVKYGQLGPLSRDLRISQTDYEKITAPNTFSQNDQIFRVSILLSILSFILRHIYICLFYQSAPQQISRSGGSKGGAPLACALPYGPKFSQFHAVFGKIRQIYMLASPTGLAPRPTENPLSTPESPCQ